MIIWFGLPRLRSDTNRTSFEVAADLAGVSPSARQAALWAVTSQTPHMGQESLLPSSSLRPVVSLVSVLLQEKLRGQYLGTVWDSFDDCPWGTTLSTSSWQDLGPVKIPGTTVPQVQSSWQQSLTPCGSRPKWDAASGNNSWEAEPWCAFSIHSPLYAKWIITVSEGNVIQPEKHM